MHVFVGHEKATTFQNEDSSTPELKILIDAVRAAGFITEKKTQDLIRKIAFLEGDYQEIFQPPNRYGILLINITTNRFTTMSTVLRKQFSKTAAPSLYILTLTKIAKEFTEKTGKYITSNRFPSFIRRITII